jgi:sulfate transport system permease protein
MADPDFLQSVKMTLLLSAVAVPINTVFGVSAALLLARNEFPGKVFAITLLDLPFSISPVVTGMMFILLYGRKGLFAPLIAAHGFPIVFAFPGMALATLFVTMPFVVRELLPILEAMDMAEEEAARSLGASPWQVFWNVTLPNIRWGLLYGVILTNAVSSARRRLGGGVGSGGAEAALRAAVRVLAVGIGGREHACTCAAHPFRPPLLLLLSQRAMGEFGAVSVISGNIIGQTQTLTLFVESSYKEYNSEAAFAAAVLLSALALVTLVIKERVEGAAAQEVRK